jgi:hypothetical protein
MKHHPAWLTAGLLLFVVLACNLGKMKNANSNSNSNSNASTDGDTGSGNAIKEIHVAKDDGNGDPGEETDSFAPGDRTVHCVATLKEANSGTKMRFAWWAVDVQDTQNKKIQEINYTTKALENVIHGHLTYPQDWPSGKYKVEVYVNGALDKTVFYSVK